MLQVITKVSVAEALDSMHDEFIDRWRIRRSSNHAGRYGSGQVGKIENAFQCPDQTGKVGGCGDCMLCTYSRKNVQFIDHGRNRRSTKPTTVFKNRIQPIDSPRKILKFGGNNSKLKNYVTKGAWKGRKILAVAGVERMHCPTTCHFWDRCYGNNLHLQDRFLIHHPEVQEKLYRECLNLPYAKPTNRMHKIGYAIRLHVVGDFPNVEYVETWRKIMMEREDINVFGFTSLPINVERELW